MLSVLIADGLLIHQTWLAIAPVAGMGSVGLGLKSLLQVLYRNGNLYLNLLSQDYVLTIYPEARYFALVLFNGIPTRTCSYRRDQHHHWNPNDCIRRNDCRGNVSAAHRTAGGI